MDMFRYSAIIAVAVGALISVPSSAVENTWDFSVQVNAVVQSSPPRITLQWPQDTNAIPQSYTVYRKTPASTDWGGGATLSGNSTSYADNSVVTGVAYEYRVVKVTTQYNGYGYVVSGIGVPLVDNRGKLLLLVDQSIAGELSGELIRLERDLAGDGWTVLRHDLARTMSVQSVKALIVADYNSDPANVRSVFLFGHLPVPYSGLLNPDGHAEHKGAWPADVYYGDVNGAWTDDTVDFSQTLNPADSARLSNYPGDGKFDQSVIPSAVELEVGRVDLFNLPGRTSWNGPPTFPSETDLLRKYLNKDHDYRHRVSNPGLRAVVGDYTGIRSLDGFSTAGYRNFSTLVGNGNVRSINVEYNDQQGVWLPQATQADYLFAYASGAGTYASIGGIGTGNFFSADTVEFVSSNPRTVFHLLYGSWFGDWDTPDNLLRATLATNHGLAAVYSGHPHWFMHPMGLGETLGSTARLTQNNTGLYQNSVNRSAAAVHIALLGDPSLRLYPVLPPQALNGTMSGSNAALSWQASGDSNIVGYHVYRGASAGGPFSRLTGSPTTALNYLDPSGGTGAVYQVRAVKLQTTPSGSYYNGSQGLFWSGGGAGGGSGTTGSPTDTGAPIVSLTAPANGATVGGGSIAVTADAYDAGGVTGVQFRLDGSIWAPRTPRRHSRRRSTRWGWAMAGMR
jgi:hypothetical protein